MPPRPSLETKIVNPITEPGWDDRLSEFEGATIFHSSSWARLLSDSYGFKSCYVVTRENGRQVAVLPIMEVRDLRGRKKGVSLPFTDYCHPLFRDAADFRTAFRFAADAAEARTWRSLNLFGNAPFDDSVPLSAFYYRHVLRLPGDEKSMLRSFRENTRRNIRRAIKENVTITFETGFPALEIFIRLNGLTRKRHGLPPQPDRFFRRLQEIIISPGLGEVAIARLGGRPIAASVFLHTGRKAFFKYGASDERFGEARANYLVMWEALRRYDAEGYVSFCFGKTEPYHSGLLQFKTGWGAEQEVVRNYRYLVRKREFVPLRPHMAGRFEALFRHTPLPILKFIGAISYKYIA